MATAHRGQPGGTRPARRGLKLSAAGPAAVLALVCALFVAGPASAASNKVRVTNLTDLSFGTVADLTADAVQNESLCLYADTATNGYNVTATGTGPGGAFQLTSGLNALQYEVQWSSQPGQSAGVRLSSNVPLTGQTSAASHQTCSTGPATSASLIVVLRAAALSSAIAGTYGGTLTLVVGAE